MLFIAAPFGNYLKFSNTLSVVGTYTLHPRKGRLKQIIKTLRYVPGDGWVNRLELRNPGIIFGLSKYCLLYTSPSPRDRQKSRMPSSA